jgi:hypothetical protein
MYSDVLPRFPHICCRQFSGGGERVRVGKIQNTDESRELYLVQFVTVHRQT